MIVYIHSKCSTCQNALRYLEQKQITRQVKDIVTTPPTVKELEQMIAFQEGNSKRLLNTSGLVYREMQLSKKLPEMSLAEILLLLSKNGMLVKRPFLLGAQFGLVGFKKPEWDAKFT